VGPQGRTSTFDVEHQLLALDVQLLGAHRYAVLVEVETIEAWYCSPTTPSAGIRVTACVRSATSSRPSNGVCRSVRRETGRSPTATK
jgi:hypothetical protein